MELTTTKPADSALEGQWTLEHLLSFPEYNPNPIVESDLWGRVSYANPIAAERFPDLASRGNDHPLLASMTGLLAAAGKDQTTGLLAATTWIWISARTYCSGSAKSWIKYSAWPGRISTTGSGPNWRGPKHRCGGW